MIRGDKKLVSMALAALLYAFLPFQGANAATGQTDVTVNFPDIIILHYPNSLTLNFTASDANIDEGGLSATDALGATASLDANIIPLIAGDTYDTDTVAATVSNVWAVRGITASGSIDVAVNLDAATASNGTSDAVMSALQVQTASVAAGDPIQVAAPGLRAVNATVGDIVFDLDISGVTASGDHTGIQYTITATATP